MGSMHTRQEQRHFASNGDRPDDMTGEWENGMGSIPETPANLYQKPTRASPEFLWCGARMPLTSPA